MKLDVEKTKIAMSKKLWSTSDLAAAYGVTRQRMTNIMNSRNIMPKTAGKIAKALEVDVTEILANE